MKPPHPYYVLGRYFFWKYRDLSKRKGIPYAEARMRRDGVPEPFRPLILTSKGYEPEPKPADPMPPTLMQRLLAFLFSNAPKGTQ